MLSRLYHILKSATGLIVILAFALIVILFLSLSQPVQQENGSSPLSTPKKSPSPLSIVASNTSLSTPRSETTATVTQEVAYPVPEVVSIASQDMTTADTLAPGLKIVYAETDGQAGETQIWMSNVTQLAKRSLLTKFTHKEEYGSGGEVAPDGNNLFYVVIPPDASSTSITQIGYELDVLRNKVV